MNKNRLFYNFVIILSPFIIILLIFILLFIFKLFSNQTYYNILLALKKLKSNNNFIIYSLFLQFLLLFFIPFILILFKYKNIPFYKKVSLDLLFQTIKFLFLSFLLAIFIQLIFSLFLFNGKTISENYESYIDKIFNLSGFYAFIFIVILAPLSEEFYFRGLFYLFKENFNEKIFNIFYFISSSLIFSIFHFDFIRIPYLLIISLSFCYVFLWTKNLWYTTIFHFFINFSQFLLIYSIKYLDKILEYREGSNSLEKKGNLNLFLIFFLFFIVLILINKIYNFIKSNKINEE